MEIITNIIQTTLESFDFAYCIAVNVLTYLVIKFAADAKNKILTIWQKRLILLIVILFTGVVYYIIGTNAKVLLNSAILAPVSWSWIFKPLCAKFGFDYKQLNDFN